MFKCVLQFLKSLIVSSNNKLDQTSDPSFLNLSFNANNNNFQNKVRVELNHFLLSRHYVNSNFLATTIDLGDSLSLWYSPNICLKLDFVIFCQGGRGFPSSISRACSIDSLNNVIKCRQMIILVTGQLFRMVS